MVYDEAKADDVLQGTLKRIHRKQDTLRDEGSCAVGPSLPRAALAGPTRR